MSWQAVLLDFDGVVLESNWAKTEGFRKLFAEHPGDAVEAMIRYHERNGGISRYRKIEHFYREILGGDITPQERDRLARRFSEITTDLVLSSPFVPGAEEFLRRSRDHPLFLVTGADQEETRHICRERGIFALFRETLGSPAPKGELIAGILARHGFAPERVAMVGDSRNDLKVSLENGIAFVARARKGTDWVPPDITRIDDLRGLEQVLSALSA